MIVARISSLTTVLAATTTHSYTSTLPSLWACSSPWPCSSHCTCTSYCTSHWTCSSPWAPCSYSSSSRHYSVCLFLFLFPKTSLLNVLLLLYKCQCNRKKITPDSLSQTGISCGWPNLPNIYQLCVNYSIVFLLPVLAEIYWFWTDIIAEAEVFILYLRFGILFLLLWDVVC